MSNIKPVDPALLAEIRASVRFAEKHGDTEIVKQTAASLSNYQPSTRSTMPGVGYLQSAFIGTELLPEIIAAPDGQEQASFPVFGKEAFFVADDVVAVGGSVKRTDLGISWTSKTLDYHAKEAYVEPREVRALNGATSEYDLVQLKVDLVKFQIDTAKEAAAATLLTTDGSYASATYYSTLSGTTQWSHASSTPLSAIEAKREVVRAAIGVRPNVLWLSPTAFSALRWHSTVTSLMNGGSTKQNLGGPATSEILASLLGMNVFVGDAIKTTTVGGTSTDIWADCAGLLYIGGAGIVSPKFGATFRSGQVGGKLEQYRDEKQGAEGSDVYRYIDVYKHIVTLNTAGYLWHDVTA